MTNAMSSFMQLCGNEIVNAARLRAYVDNGIKPYGFDILCHGCDGLDVILPCIDSDPPIDGYALPELDPAPWYDAAAPESQNFAGLLVTSVTVSAPYQRSTTSNIGMGQTLGRMKLQGRTIVVNGWLVGKTCCATQYGLKWLTAALGDAPCAGNGCGGCSFEYLDCCPAIGEEEGDCLTTNEGNVYVRPAADTEYQRAEDFFRRINGVGTIDGPNVLSCKGSNCGCGCSALLEVEFTLASSSPYFNSFGTPILTDEPANTPCVDTVCDITWVKLADGDPCPPDLGCSVEVDCLEDPQCPLPPLPPTATIPASPCACLSLETGRICTPIVAAKEWGSSTLNIDVFSGASDLRNLAIRLWQNPNGLACDDPSFDDCNACSTLLISYIPANSNFVMSGETRTVTIECNGRTRNAAPNVTNLEGQPFEWLDLTCFSACVCVDFDCNNTDASATITITRVDRDL